MDAATRTRWGAIAVVTAPAVIAVSLFSHPWIGNPGDDGFHAALADAVAADTTRWVAAHLAVAVGSALLILSFMAIRAHLRDAGDDVWSAWGLPFIVVGSVLFAMLPAMEMAPVAASDAGVDAAAVQASLMRWFVPTHLASGVLFLIGTIGFVKGLAETRAFSRGTTWVAGVALLVMAVARLPPLGLILLYVGPLAGLVALWPLGLEMWRAAGARSPAGSRATPT